MKSVYLDHAAATPLDPAVRAAMQPYLGDQFYNPSSLYAGAKSVRQALEAARQTIAKTLGAKKSEIIFTAGGTESVNLAIQGVLTEFPDKKFVTTAIEHEAVLATFNELTRRGHHTAIVPIKPDGIVDVAAIEKVIDDNTVLISVMSANNEIGTLQPIAKIARLVADIRLDRAKRGVDWPLYLHADACQAGSQELAVSRLGVDLLTLNGSKIYGPKQTGLLYVRTGTQIRPLIHGGGQERGLRSGTENVAGVVGFAKALELIQADRQAENRRLTALRDGLFADLQTVIPDLALNGHRTQRLPNNLNFYIPGIDGEQAVLYLDQAGFQISTGSACSTGRTDPSHVLLALGLTPAQANASLRLTLGRSTTKAQLTALTKVLPGIVTRLRQLAKTAPSR